MYDMSLYIGQFVHTVMVQVLHGGQAPGEAASAAVQHETAMLVRTAIEAQARALAVANASLVRRRSVSQVLRAGGAR